jgi:hypothetical protein
MVSLTCAHFLETEGMFVLTELNLLVSAATSLGRKFPSNSTGDRHAHRV